MRLNDTSPPPGNTYLGTMVQVLGRDEQGNVLVSMWGEQRMMTFDYAAEYLHGVKVVTLDKDQYHVER